MSTLENGLDHNPGIEHLATQINEQTTQIKLQTDAIKDQTSALKAQTTGLDKLVELYQRAVPMKMMLLNFGMIFGLFFGIEAVRLVFKLISKHFGID